MKARVWHQCVNRAPPCTQGQPKCIVSGSNLDGGNEAICMSSTGISGTESFYSPTNNLDLLPLLKYSENSYFLF